MLVTLIIGISTMDKPEVMLVTLIVGISIVDNVVCYKQFELPA